MSKMTELLEGASDFEKQLKELTKEVGNLKTQKSNLESDIVTLSGKKSDLTKAIKDLDATLDVEVKKAVIKGQAKIDALQNDAEEALKKVRAEQVTVNNKSKELDALISENKAAVKKNSDFNQDLQHKMVEIDAAKKKLSDIVSMIEGALK